MHAALAVREDVHGSTCNRVGCRELRIHRALFDAHQIHCIRGNSIVDADAAPACPPASAAVGLPAGGESTRMSLKLVDDDAGTAE